MRKIAPTLVFGTYLPGEWVSRYARFRVDNVPPGAHQLIGRTYNPEGDDLHDNLLQIIVQRGLVATVRPADPPEWRNFTVDLPEMETAKTLYIVLRTTHCRIPPLPDERLLGLILDDLSVHLDPGATRGYDDPAPRET